MSSHRAWVAGSDDVQAAAVLLDAFNAEFDDPSPGPELLAARLRELIAVEAVAVLLAGEGPDGVAVMRVRPALWSDANEAYLEELYVVPARRRQGIGGTLLSAVLELARERGCIRIDLGTDEGDEDAQRLYGRFGFTNYADEHARERMLFYERDLQPSRRGRQPGTA